MRIVGVIAVLTLTCWLCATSAAYTTHAGVAPDAGPEDRADPEAGAGDRSDPESAEDDKRIEELERKLEILTEEFDKLRRGEALDEADDVASGSRGKHGLGPAASRVYHQDHGVSIGGYGEWLYQDFDDSLDDGTDSDRKATADFLRLVLYAGYKFNDKVLLNSEIEFEHASTGEDGEVSVEFAYLDFFVRPEINVRTGLVLVPVGLINEIHEPTTYFGARRPSVESVLLPTTWRELGAGVFGDVGPFSYRAYLTTSLDGSEFSASSGIRGGRQDGSKSEAEDLAISGRVDYVGLPGLLVGAAAFHGGSGQGEMVNGSTVDGTVSTVDLHAEWRWRGLELRGLWAEVEVDDAAELSSLAGETIGSRMTGWYAQAGYDLLASTRHHARQLIPFVRYEEVDTQDDVPDSLADTVTGENDREETTFGLVFKPIPQVAVKVDFQEIDNRAGTGQDQFNVAVGFAF